MSKSSDSGIAALIWAFGMLFLLYKVLFYFAVGKKRGQTMFGAKPNKPTIVNTVPNTSNPIPPVQDTATIESSMNDKPIILHVEAVSTTPSRNVNQIVFSWNPAGSEVIIQDITIKGGLIYTGQYDGEYPFSTNPSCVLTNLNVLEPTKDNSNGFDPPEKTDSIGYYPSYKGLSAIQRKLYLDWLAGGRQDPDIEIGYVFIFFYGLEHRALVDSKKMDVTKDCIDIISEVQRLLSIYGTNRSFKHYATDFLTLLHVSYSKEITPYNPKAFEKTYGIPISLNYEISRRITNGLPITAEIALSWFYHASGIWYYYGSKDKVIQELTQALFLKHYQQKYGEGLLLKTSKSFLTIYYHPANNQIGAISIKDENMLDISRFTVALSKIESIYGSCSELLNSFNRFILRKPELSHTILAFAFLPSDLIEDIPDKIIQKNISWINQILHQKEFAVINSKELFANLELKQEKKISKVDSIAIVQYLSLLKVGIEPDIRFTNHRLVDIQNIVVFRLNEKAEATPTEDYTFALFFLELAVYVGGGETIRDETEKVHLQKWIHSIKEFSTTEKTRLSMHLEWLICEKPELISIKKRMQVLSDSQKESFITLLIGIADIDGKIEPGEIKILQKIYTWMGFDPDRLFSDIHKFQSNEVARQPVTILKADRTKKEFQIPKQEDKDESVKLDEKKIKRKIEETKQVNSILTSVFSNEDDVNEKLEKKSEKSVNLIAGLDELHSALLLELLKKPVWERIEFESICQEKGLFADGALEMINEAAYGIADEPLLEEDENITVSNEVANMMKKI